MSTRRKEIASRACAGCRALVPATAALRWFVDPAGELWPDWTGRSRKLGGRGATTHMDPACIRQANDRGGIRRALKGSYQKIASDLLIERAVLLGEQAFYARLGLALRAGALFPGAAAVREAFKVESAALLIVASDAGASGRQRVLMNAERKSCPVVEVVEGAHLGQVLGREFVGAALVKESAFGRTLVAWSRGLCSLGAPSLARCLESSDVVLDEVSTGLVVG